MNDSDEKKNLINTCALIIYDISYLIWLREVSHNVIEDRNDAVVSFPSEDETGLQIYKAFRNQLKNLQKYSSLVSKFREIEKFIEDIEDNLLCEGFVLDSDIFHQIIRQVTILKKCKFYSKKMGSIMHRVMPQNNSIKASIVHDIMVDNYQFQKNDIVDIITMENRIKWKIKIKTGAIYFISPLFLKMHSEKAEQLIIDRLIVRMKNLCCEVFDNYLKMVCKEMNDIHRNLSFDESILEVIALTREYLAEKNENYSFDIENDLKSMEKIYKYLQYWDFQKSEMIVTKRKTSSSAAGACTRTKLNFRIEVSDKNISNKDYMEQLCNRSHSSTMEGRSLYSPF